VPALLLDTCAVLAIAQGHTITPAARAEVVAAFLAEAAYVSAVSAWEIAQKVALGRLVLAGHAAPRALFDRIRERSGFRVVDAGPDIMLGAYELPSWDHRDPADRMIVATARMLEAPVLTSDRHILAYADAGHVGALSL
jgi:PIN domain nuclease of toxin-antitoxin system